MLSSFSYAEENQIHNLVTKKAIEHSVPPRLAHAVVKVESRYIVNARNGSSIGLGQIQCRTAKGIGLTGDCKRLFDPETNLHYSFKYLKMALDKAQGNMCHAATLYNRGLGVKPSSSGYCNKVYAAMGEKPVATTTKVVKTKTKKSKKETTIPQEDRDALTKLISGQFN